MSRLKNMMSKLFKPIDMTTGTPWKKITLFMIPMLLGNIAQQLYNTVDSIVVGRYIGDSALAAVGSAGPVVNLLIVLFVGISVGASIMVSQYLGAKNREGLSETIGNCLTLTLLASLVIMVVATLLTRPMLSMLNTPDSLIDWCTSYLQILFLGSTGLAFFNILSGVLRGLGDSVSALVYLLVSCIINIVLDIYFVSELGLGISGVAYATVVAQWAAGVLCFLKLNRMKALFDIKRSTLKLKRKFAGGIIKLGLPSGITQAILAASMLLVQSLTNSFGEMLIAANVIVMRVDGFAMLPNQSFGNALTTYAGQNVGAGNYDRVKKGAKQGTFLSVVITIAITFIILLFGRNLMGIFTNTQELVDMSIKMMIILAPGYAAMGIVQALSGIMRGAGDTLTPMWIAITMTLIIRVPLAYGLAYITRSSAFPQGRPEVIFISLGISFIIGAIGSVWFYKKGRWKRNRMISD